MSRIDLNGNGLLDKLELSVLLRELGRNEIEIKYMLKACMRMTKWTRARTFIITRTCANVCASARVHAFERACTRLRAHTYLHARTHAGAHARPAHMCAVVCAYMRAHACEPANKRDGVCAHVRMHTRLLTPT